MKTYNRLFENNINQWYRSDNPDALIVEGARQVGKTTGILHWAEVNNIKMLYIDLLKNKKLSEELCSTNSYDDAIRKISIRLSVNLNEYDVLFLDEIQVHYDLLYLSRIFKGQKIRLICSGSLLGIRLASEINRSDLGSKSYLRVYPLDFKEFLIWSEEKILLDEIDNAFNKSEQIFNVAHEKIMELFYKYLVIGGMPSVVALYIETNKTITPELYQKKEWILKEYKLDNHNNEYMGTQLRKEVIANMESMFEKIPFFLSQPNKRFIIDSIGKNIRYKNIEKPLTALVSSNLVIPSYLVESPGFPLHHHKKEDSLFKLYYSDIGLLTSELNIDYNMVLNWLDKENKLSGIMGGVIENYVAISLQKEELYFFKKSIQEKGKVRTDTYEIDFLFNSNDGSIIPCEVKSRASKWSKATSLDWYKKKYEPSKILCIGPNNFHINNNEMMIPLYAIHKIRDWLK